MMGLASALARIAEIVGSDNRLLQTSYDDRKNRARKMRKDTMNAVEISFNSYLHQRGFTGGLNINKVHQELQLEVSRLSSTANYTLFRFKPHKYGRI